jgi:hypothetical protein
MGVFVRLNHAIEAIRVARKAGRRLAAGATSRERQSGPQAVRVSRKL